MVTDHPRSSSRESKVALHKGVSSQRRVWVGVGDENFSSPVSPVSSVHVAGGIPRRSHHQGREVASCFPHFGTREASLQKAQVQATVPPVTEQLSSPNVPRGASQALPSGSSGPRIGILNVRRSWLKQKNVWCAFGKGNSSDGRSYRDGLGSGGQGLAASDCGVGGSTTIFGDEPGCCVASEQSSVEPVQVVQERATKRRVCGDEVPSSPQLLSEWLCAKHLELRDVLEMGDPLIVAELIQLLAAGGAKMQAM